MSKININLKFFLLLLPILLFANCNKDNNNGYYEIPDVYVNKYINLDLPSYSALLNLGGYVVIGNVGYKGIIIYHDVSDEYFAIERACTYRTSDDCAVVSVENSGTSLKCGHYSGSDWISCCDSKFKMDGTVLNGPATISLKRYNVIRSANTLTITN